MQIKKFDDRESWEIFRRGKLGGSRVKDLVCKKGFEEKVGYYTIIAERLAAKPDGENPMMRGIRIEEEALNRFEKETKKKLNKELVIWQDEKIPSLTVSPDGYVDTISGKRTKKITEAVECKALNSERHVEALIKQKVPKDYEEQIKWYFVINPDLKKLYMVFYDPRMAIYDFFYITINRNDYEKNELSELKEEMVEKMKKIDEQVDILVKGTKLEF